MRLLFPKRHKQPCGKAPAPTLRNEDGMRKIRETLKLLLPAAAIAVIVYLAANAFFMRVLPESTALAQTEESAQEEAWTEEKRGGLRKKHRKDMPFPGWGRRTPFCIGNSMSGYRVCAGRVPFRTGCRPD